MDPLSGGSAPSRRPPPLLAAFNRVLVLAGLLWTAVGAVSLAYHVVDVRRHVEHLARNEADESIGKDLLYRRWAAGHGGVYVPVTPATPPNPYLKVPERDIATPSGRRLTLVNPAYMTRQVHEIGRSRGRWGHITSARPVRPENAADAWELKALAAFERGAKEYGEIATLGGEPHYRFMRPLVTEEPCLACHAADGYRLGELRGGISVAVPMSDFAGVAREHLTAESRHFGIVWALGLVGLLFAAPYGRRRILEREAAEGALERSLAFTRSLVDNDPECVKTLGPGGVLTFMNPAGLAMIGAESPEAVVGKPVLALVAPEHREAFEALTRRVFAGEAGSLEFEIVGLGGRRRWMETRAVPLRDAAGAVEGVLALSRDVSARRRAEEQLRASEERFRALFEGAPDAILLADPASGEITEANEAAARLAQRPLAALVGLRLEALYAPAAGGAALPVAPGGDLSPPAEREVVRPDGSVVPVLVGGRTMTVGGRRLAMTVLRDVGEQKEAQAQRAHLEEQLARARRLESVGRLAGGVAHDFNNMLQAIAGYAHLALLKVAPDAPAAANLREIAKAADRSAELTRQLLTFARREVGSPRPIDLNAAIEGTLGTLRRLVGQGVEVAWTPGPGLWPVRIDPGQADQLLVNLGVNARDAVGGSGRIAIATRNIVLDEVAGRAYPGCAPGDYVLLTVADDGRGIGAQERERLFEPFYTTKGVGEGTGLGLAIVYGVVTEAGGGIDVASAAGRGTTFSIVLPRCPEAVRTASDREPGR